MHCSELQYIVLQCSAVLSANGPRHQEASSWASVRRQEGGFIDRESQEMSGVVRRCQEMSGDVRRFKEI